MKKKPLYLYFQTPGGQGSKLQYLCVPVYKHIYLSSFFFQNTYYPILCILMSYCLNSRLHHFLYIFCTAYSYVNPLLWCFFVTFQYIILWICLQYFASNSVLSVWVNLFMLTILKVIWSHTACLLCPLGSM